MKIISNILKDETIRKFEFKPGTGDPDRTLKNATEFIPDDKSGIYLVFAAIELSDTETHNIYKIDEKPYTLCYFGKGGGVSRNGKEFKQKLKGRINNVVSDSSRKLKDLKRGRYWALILEEIKADSFLVFCQYHENPGDVEDKIYKEFESQRLAYPIMNKKRGRKKRS
jgi:hypothetical protein